LRHRLRFRFDDFDFFDLRHFFDLRLWYLFRDIGHLKLRNDTHSSLMHLFR
jgi:hypothetical protein